MRTHVRVGGHHPSEGLDVVEWLGQHGHHVVRQELVQLVLDHARHGRHRPELALDRLRADFFLVT